LTREGAQQGKGFLCSRGCDGIEQWNFTKILVERHDKVIQRFEPNVDSESSELLATIERALTE
jgi:glutathione peroxidase-family protein